MSLSPQMQTLQKPKRWPDDLPFPIPYDHPAVLSTTQNRGATRITLDPKYQETEFYLPTCAVVSSSGDSEPLTCNTRSDLIAAGALPSFSDLPIAAGAAISRSLNDQISTDQISTLENSTRFDQYNFKLWSPVYPPCPRSRYRSLDDGNRPCPDNGNARNQGGTGNIKTRYTCGWCGFEWKQPRPIDSIKGTHLDVKECDIEVTNKIWLSRLPNYTPRTTRKSPERKQRYNRCAKCFKNHQLEFWIKPVENIVDPHVCIQIFATLQEKKAWLDYERKKQEAKEYAVQQLASLRRTIRKRYEL